MEQEMPRQIEVIGAKANNLKNVIEIEMVRARFARLEGGM